MATDDLITRYVADVRRKLSFRRDADRLAAEVDDHLRESTIAKLRAGETLEGAQRAALADFGTSSEVARSICATGRGGLAAPTRQTRMSGAAALLGAGLWVLAGVVGLAGLRSVDEIGLPLWLAWVSIVLLACLMSTLALGGALERTGGLHDALTVAILLLGLVGALAMAVLAWAWMFVAAPMWLAYAFLVLRLRPLGLDAPGVWLHLVAWPAGLAVFVWLETAGVGPVDRYGDHPLAFTVGFATMATLWAVAQVVLGRRLLAEDPLELSPSPVAI